MVTFIDCVDRRLCNAQFITGRVVHLLSTGTGPIHTSCSTSQRDAVLYLRHLSAGRLQINRRKNPSQRQKHSSVKVWGLDSGDTLFRGIVLYCIVLYCIVLYCIVLYCIVLYCIVLYCIVLYCIVLYCIVLYCIVLYCIVLYCIVLYCIVLYCIVLYCIVLYCIVLYCIVLYCIVLFSIETFLVK